MTSHHDGVVG